MSARRPNSAMPRSALRFGAGSFRGMLKREALLNGNSVIGARQSAASTYMPSIPPICHLFHLYALPACGYGKAARSASSAHISSWRSCSSREASVSRSVVSRVRSARRRVLGLKWLHAANERIWHSAVASLAAPHSAPGPLAPEVTPEGPVAWLGLGAWLGVWLER